MNIHISFYWSKIHVISGAGTVKEKSFVLILHVMFFMLIMSVDVRKAQMTEQYLPAICPTVKHLF